MSIIELITLWNKNFFTSWFHSNNFHTFYRVGVQILKKKIIYDFLPHKDWNVLAPVETANQPRFLRSHTKKCINHSFLNTNHILGVRRVEPSWRVTSSHFTAFEEKKPTNRSNPIPFWNGMLFFHGNQPLLEANQTSIGLHDHRSVALLTACCDRVLVGRRAFLRILSLFLYGLGSKVSLFRIVFWSRTCDRAPGQKQQDHKSWWFMVFWSWTPVGSGCVASSFFFASCNNR